MKPRGQSAYCRNFVHGANKEELVCFQKSSFWYMGIIKSVQKQNCLKMGFIMKGTVSDRRSIRGEMDSLTQKPEIPIIPIIPPD